MNNNLHSPNLDYGPQRASWRIKIAVSDVQTACAAQLAHHEERLQVWRDKEVQAEKDLRANGIMFREEVRGGGGAMDPLDQYQYAAYRGEDNPQITGTMYQQAPEVDQKYWKTLQQAQTKVREHLGHVRQYTQWQKMLSLMTGEIELTIADVEFFDLGSTFAVRVPQARELAATKS